MLHYGQYQCQCDCRIKSCDFDCGMNFDHLTNIDFILAKSGGRSVPNMELLRKHLLREGHINKAELIEIIAAAV